MKNVEKWKLAKTSSPYYQQYDVVDQNGDRVVSVPGHRGLSEARMIARTPELVAGCLKALQVANYLIATTSNSGHALEAKKLRDMVLPLVEDL